MVCAVCHGAESCGKTQDLTRATAVIDRFTTVSQNVIVRSGLDSKTLTEETCRHHITFIACKKQNLHRGWNFRVHESQHFIGSLTQPVIISVVHLPALGIFFLMGMEPQLSWIFRMISRVYEALCSGHLVLHDCLGHDLSALNHVRLVMVVFSLTCNSLSSVLMDFSDSS